MPRNDYKELAELSLIFLGAEKKISFQKPGATSNARWMSKAIYVLKMLLFREQYSLGDKETSFFQVGQFIVFVYIEAWYTSPLPAEAPNNDLQLVKNFEEFRSIDEEISSLAMKKIKNHLWYLSPECSALSFFDESIQVEMKRKMISALKKENILYTSDYNKKFPPKKIKDLLSEEIEYFISMDSLNFFDRFKLGKDFLKFDPSSWPSNECYLKNKQIVNCFRVVNDVSERAVKLATDYNNKLTENEEQKQFLLQVVANYKRSHPDSSKETIVKRYKKDYANV